MKVPKDLLIDFLGNISHEIIDVPDYWLFNNNLDAIKKIELLNYWQKENQRTKIVISNSLGRLN